MKYYTGLTVSLLFVIFFCCVTIAQPKIDWQASPSGVTLLGFGSTSLIQTRDGGYVFAGQGGQILADDAVITKMRADGSIQWQKTFGGPGRDFAFSIIQTSDGGYLFAGQTDSLITEGVHFHGKGDAWLVKMDSNGRMEWQQCYGGSNFEQANSVIQTSDGNYVFTGITDSQDGDVKGDHSNAQDPQHGPTLDAWVVKIDRNGKLLWQKCFGGGLRDWGNGILQNPDSTLVFAGYTESSDGDIPGNPQGEMGMWVIHLKDTLIIWQKFFYYHGSDNVSSLCRTADGDYVIAGTIIDNDTIASDGITRGSDLWAVKLDSAGTMLWQRCMGGSADDGALSVAATSDSGSVIAGFTFSADKDLESRIPAAGDPGDVWIIKLSKTGETEWHQWYGGSKQDDGYSVVNCKDGGIAFAALTVSSDGDVKSNTTKSWNSWIVKLKSDLAAVTVNRQEPMALTVSPNPAGDKLIVHYALKDISGSLLEIYDLLGRRLTRLDDNDHSIGEHLLTVDVSGLIPGNYVLKLQAGVQNSFGKFTVFR